MILRFCIGIPTYNNPETIQSVVLGCLAETPYEVIVIDDGSMPAVELAPDPRVTLLRLPENQGKGRALQAGFREAVSRGFTHLIAVDGDGQHLPREVFKLTSEATEDPWALVIGNRNLGGGTVPEISKFGRKFSNFWVQFETQRKIEDSQSGFRVYPLVLVQNMRFWTRRFDFEIEVLIRLMWKGVAVREVAIECFYPDPSQRVSHFDKVWDNVRVSLLNTLLVSLSLLRSEKSPARTGLAIGVGVLIGCTPFFGLHTLIAIGVALALRLNLVYVWLATQISIPPLAPLLALMSIRAGAWLTGQGSGTVVGFSKDWLAGSFVVGAGLGIAIGTIGGLIAWRFNQVRGASSWSGRNRGGRFGNGFVKVFTRVLGLRAGYALLRLIVPYFYLFAPRARRALDEYWSIRRPALGFWARQVQIIRHLYRFAQILLDRVYQGFHPQRVFIGHGTGMDYILSSAESASGAILLSAHVGSWEMALACLRSHGLEKKFVSVQFHAGGPRLDDSTTTEATPDSLADTRIETVFINRAVQPVLELRERLSQGLPVGLMADRPVGGQYELVSMMGKLCAIDVTSFRVAIACGAPLLFTFGFRGGDGEYQFYAEPQRVYRYTEGVDRDFQCLLWAQEYARVLERFLEKYPDQWFNFFPFFSEPPSPPATSAQTAKTRTKNRSWPASASPTARAAEWGLGAKPNGVPLFQV